MLAECATTYGGVPALARRDYQKEMKRSKYDYVPLDMFHVMCPIYLFIFSEETPQLQK